MKRAVIDAATLLTWFDPDGTGRTMRTEYEAGELVVVAPRTIVADAIGLLAERPGWSAERLERAATELGRLGVELHDPPNPELARYVATGLPANLAAYPALAASLDLPLTAADERLREAAGALIATS
jgi:predicted nucleic acid-binding protein